MLKRLCIKNYKSLKDLDIELGKRNVLVGPNMSGKSNFIDSLRFLSQVCIGGVK
ncbi:MAG: AAA family ATPase [Thermodesulfobacteriota bacterium]